MYRVREKPAANFGNRVNNSRNEKEAPETVKSPGRVKGLNCWWQQAEQLWDLLLHLLAAPVWAGGKADCSLQRGRLSRQASQEHSGDRRSGGY